MFKIVDTFTKETVATRKSVAAARSWSLKLNDGLSLVNGVPRYVVTKGE